MPDNTELLEHSENNSHVTELRHSPQQFAMQLVSGLAFSCAVKSATNLGVLSALKDGTSSVADMAEELGLNEQNLGRLLDALCSIGIVEKTGMRAYRLSEVGLALAPGETPQSIEPLARYLLHDVIALPMLDMSYSVATGKASFEKIKGMSWYNSEHENREYLDIMDKAMEAYSKLSLPLLLENYDFSRYSVVVDVAGGMGQMLSGILKSNSALRGMLFDQKQTIEKAEEFIKKAGLDGRCELIAGDFFKAIPAGGDLYIISKALNDWDDDSAREILGNIAAAMTEKATLIIIEQLGGSGNPSPEEAFRDLLFMVCSNGGRVRSEGELKKLAGESGLAVTNTIHLKPFSILECVVLPSGK